MPGGTIRGNICWSRIPENIQGTLEQLKRDVREFEVKKRTVSIESGTRFITRLSPVLNQKYSAEEKKLMESSCLKNQVALVRDKIQISRELMKTFYTDSLRNIVKHVKEILKCIQNVNTILLVGGYSESHLLHEKINAEF